MRIDLTSAELAMLRHHYPYYRESCEDEPRKMIQDRLVNKGLLFRIGSHWCGISDLGISVLDQYR